MADRGGKATQRERILTGMLDSALRHGYAGASIARAIGHAGVSRPAFYEYFANREDCLLTLQRECSRRLLAHIRAAIADAAPERAPNAAVAAILEHAEQEPERARFLMDEAPAGGTPALKLRGRAIEAIVQALERAREQAPARAATPDLPAAAAIGGVLWLLAPLLRGGERDLREQAGELDRWLDGYLAPNAHRRWRALEPGPPLRDSAFASDLAPRAPRPLPPGRPYMSSAEVARNQRERILYATAEVAARKGYVATTVSDIARAASLDRRVFYSHFPDKQRAFLAVHEFAVRHTMAIAAEAYFSEERWPDRIWEGIRASCQFDATHAAITRIGFVESHAVGAAAIQRVEDSQAAFTIFLQEGYRHAATPPPAIAPRAVIASIFEIGHRQALAGAAHLLPRLAAHASHLALTPFLGADAANKLIDRKQRTARVDA